MECRKCKSELIIKERVFSNSTRHKERVCSNCGLSYGYVKSTPDDEFRMPFGLHKGKLLIDIARDNRDYLYWVLEDANPANNLRERIMAVLNPKGQTPMEPRIAKARRVTESAIKMLEAFKTGLVKPSDLPSGIREKLKKLLE